MNFASNIDSATSASPGHPIKCMWFSKHERLRGRAWRGAFRHHVPHAPLLLLINYSICLMTSLHDFASFIFRTCLFGMIWSRSMI